jgi:hypothetical protein
MAFGMSSVVSRSYLFNSLKRLNMTKRKTKSYKVGRDAATGQFIPVEVAKRRKKTAIVETIKR